MNIPFEQNIVVTGHYGSGKTNLSLNLAMAFRERGEEVALADLDVVNPYFRSSDFRALAAQNGIDLVASDYAGSSLDIPALTGRLDAAIHAGKRLIIDVGGDDAGAIALGRYAATLRKREYSMLYVVNAYRYLVREPEESAALLREIEAVSRLRATHLVNCSNLGPNTTAEEIRASMDYVHQVAGLTGLTLAFTAARKAVAEQLTDIQDVYPVYVYVTAPWNEAEQEGGE